MATISSWRRRRTQGEPSGGSETADMHGTGPYTRGSAMARGARTARGNDLGTLHPGLAAEWHPERNGGLTPRDIVPGSRRKVWWRAACGHQWRTAVFVRSRGSGCPACVATNESRQQTDLELALLVFVPGLSLRHRAIAAGDRLWRCDMVWPGRKLVVEYDGSYWHRNTEKRDKQKAMALRQAGWTVVRVDRAPSRGVADQLVGLFVVLGSAGALSGSSG